MRRVSETGAEKLFFALKACYRLPVLRALQRLGMGAEVMSELEYELALAAGFPPSEILVNGLGREESFLARVVDEGCTVIADTVEEYRSLGTLVEHRRLGLRLKPSLPAELCYHRPSKLGLPWETFHRLVTERPPAVLHLHVASQQTHARPFIEVLETLPWREFEVLNLGGGWETAQDVEAKEFEALGSAFARLYPAASLWLEPGRAVVNGAGYLLTTIRAIKRSEGKNYIIIDAPTSTLMPHKEATYRLIRPIPGEQYRADLVDGITSMTSTLKIDQGFAEKPEIGQRLLLGNVGAYTTAMSQFWAFPPVPTYFLSSNDELQADLTLERIRKAREQLLFAENEREPRE